MEIRINGVEELGNGVETFLKSAKPGMIYALYGGMGAGKTTFVGELCRRLGSSDEVTSPTFSIVNEYDTEQWGKVYHLDCYRLESEEEGFDAGVEDYFNSGFTCFVEWPERIDGILPDEVVNVTFRVEENGERILTLQDPLQ